MERQGRETRLQVWEGMKGFHGNLCLPITKVVLQIPQAAFPWTLKPTPLAAKSPTLGDWNAVESESERNRE